MPPKILRFSYSGTLVAACSPRSHLATRSCIPRHDPPHVARALAEPMPCRGKRPFVLRVTSPLYPRSAPPPAPVSTAQLPLAVSLRLVGTLPFMATKPSVRTFAFIHPLPGLPFPPGLAGPWELSWRRCDSFRGGEKVIPVCQQRPLPYGIATGSPGTCCHPGAPR